MKLSMFDPALSRKPLSHAAFCASVRTTKPGGSSGVIIRLPLARVHRDTRHGIVRQVVAPFVKELNRLGEKLSSKCAGPWGSALSVPG